MNELHFGFVVGINSYPGLTDLQGPVADAAAFREWLVDPDHGGLPVENVYQVSGTPAGVQVRAGDARPTRSDIVSALYDVNEQVRQAIGDDPERYERSRLYVFLAGHGIAPGKGAALLPANARRGLFGENLEVGRFRDWYEDCGLVRELVVFCDFCRNRIALAEAGPLGFTRCGSSRGQVETFVGYAAAYDRVAYEEHEETIPADQRRGYFSRALLEALSGAGAGGAEITSDTVASYVRQRVHEQTADRVPAQEARFPNDLRAPLRFGAAVPVGQPVRQVVIEPPAGKTGPIRLLDHQHRPVTGLQPGQGGWVVTLPDGLYAVVDDGSGRGDGFAGGGLFKVLGEDRHVRL